MIDASQPDGKLVAVSLLGPARITGPDAVLRAAPLGRRAELAFARLALEAGSVVPREMLADAIWGPSLPDSWRSSLRNVIVRLRRALAETGLGELVQLTTSGNGYVLGLPAGSTVDLRLLREETDEAVRQLAAGELKAALELAARALPDASRTVLPGGAEEWVEGLRGEVADLWRRLELIAGESALALGDPGRAERLARALVTAEPLREDGQRLLISALRSAGRRAEALSAYDAFRRRLARELGALPAPMTQQLFLEILAEERDEEPKLPRGDGAVPVAGALLRLAEGGPFVGRDRLLAELRSWARLSVRAGACVVCVSGEPGLGKTRLAAQLAAICQREGMGVLYGRAEDRPGLPYAALVESLERGLESWERSELQLRLRGELEVLERLLPSLRDRASVGTHDVTVDPAHVRRAFVSALRLLAGEGALLVLDDAQWISAAEVEVLMELLFDPAPTPVLVLILHRDPREDGALLGLGEQPRLERRELEPLSEDEVVELVRLTVADEREADLNGRARQLWRLSGGNPLLASELLDTAGTDGKAVGSVRVEQLVRERLGSLPAGTEEALRVAALAGTEFDPQLVCALSSEDPLHTMELLRMATAARLLVEAPDGRLAFRHGLVRDALLQRIDLRERAGLHQRLGLGLEADGSPDPLGLARLAYHFAAAGPSGDPALALHYALPVARKALEVGVFEDVIAVASRALDALAQAGDPDPHARLELEVLWGGAQQALGHPQGAETLLAAFGAARDHGDGALMADAVLALSPPGALCDVPAVDERQLVLYEQAIAALGDGEPTRRAKLLARVASALAWARSEAESRPVAERAQALARELGDERALAGVLAVRRRSLTGSADLELVRRLEDELDDVADRLSDPDLRLSTALWRFDSAVQHGEGEPLEALLDEAGQHGRSLRRGDYHHTLAYEHAALALLRGRLTEAETLVARAAQIGQERGLDPVVVESIRLTQMMLVRGEQRRLGELRQEAAPLFETAGVTMWRGAMAVIEAAAGQLDGVAERIDAVLDDYERNGPTMLCSGSVIAYLAGTVIALAEAGRARRVLKLILPLSGQGAYFAGFAGPVDYHLGLLERFLDDEESAVGHLVDAARFCDALGAPRWQARVAATLHLL